MTELSEREKIAHLLRRFGLGSSQSELEYYGANGLKGAIDLLLDTDRDEDFHYSVADLVPGGNVNNPKSTQIHWHVRLLLTQTPLREKMTLFWHDHFALSGQKVDSGSALFNYEQTLRDHCLGRFQDILTAVSKDPAMIFWLDNQLNKKGKPNENFAREVMELFTLGIGHYTEKDVQEMARAFTGWGYGLRNRQIETVPRGPARFVNNANEHDDGEKVILGNRGPFDGDDACGILTGNPQTALYITKKMWEWFAYKDPEDALIERLAKQYRDNGLTASVLVRAIMESPEFYSAKAVRRLYKNPIDFCVSTMRQLGVGSTMKEKLDASLNSDDQTRRGASFPALLVQQTTVNMGMELLFPPDVSGWDGGSAWISSATMVERIKWADKIFSGRTQVGLVMLGLARTPVELARKLAEVFDAGLGEEKLKQLDAAALQACAGGILNPRNVNAACDAVSRLIFGSPEFQFC